MASAFFTVGHITRSTADLAALLQEAEAALVVTVRAFSRSRTDPQFNFDVLPEGLGAWQIGYRHSQTPGGII